MAGDFKIKNMYLLFLAVYRVKNWFTYFLDLFNLTNKKNITYEMRDGLKYYVRAKTTDRGILNTVAIQDEYELKKLNLCNSTIIDIGGQNGYFSVFASKFANNIYTYEPVPDNFKIILKNIEINNLNDRIHPFNLAVSDKKETLKIFLSNNTGGHSIYGQGDDFIEVKTVTLSEIFEQNKIDKCDLLKIDVEGSEYNILYNLPIKYFEKIQNIRMEVHDIDNTKKNHKHLIKFFDIDNTKKNHKHLIKFLRDKNYRIIFNKPILFAQMISRK